MTSVLKEALEGIAKWDFATDGRKFNGDYKEVLKHVIGLATTALSQYNTESPSPSIEELAQKLREENPYTGDIDFTEDKRIVWERCIDEMIKLSKERK